MRYNWTAKGTIKAKDDAFILPVLLTIYLPSVYANVMKIIIETKVAVLIVDVWRAFSNPDDIVQSDATDDWQTTRASNDLKIGGKLLLCIEAKNGGMGFDFAATYTQIELNRLIEFRENDGRMVRLGFIETDIGVTIFVRHSMPNQSIPKISNALNGRPF